MSGFIVTVRVQDCKDGGLRKQYQCNPSSSGVLAFSKMLSTKLDTMLLSIPSECKPDDTHCLRPDLSSQIRSSKLLVDVYQSDGKNDVTIHGSATTCGRLKDELKRQGFTCVIAKPTSEGFTGEALRVNPAMSTLQIGVSEGLSKDRFGKLSDVVADYIQGDRVKIRQTKNYWVVVLEFNCGIEGSKTLQTKDPAIWVCGNGDGRIKKVYYNKKKYSLQDVRGKVKKILARNRAGCTRCKESVKENPFHGDFKFKTTCVLCHRPIVGYRVVGDDKIRNVKGKLIARQHGFRVKGVAKIGYAHIECKELAKSNPVDDNYKYGQRHKKRGRCSLNG